MRARRKLTPQTSANLVPMIDVVFQLVIFFMVSTTFKIVPGIDLDLPHSSTAEAVTLTPVVLSIGGREQIFINDRQVPLGNLEAALREAVGRDGAVDGKLTMNGAHPIVIEGDAAVPYDLLVDVLDVLRVLGIKAASLRTRETLPGGS